MPSRSHCRRFVAAFSAVSVFACCGKECYAQAPWQVPADYWATTHAVTPGTSCYYPYSAYPQQGPIPYCAASPIDPGFGRHRPKRFSPEQKIAIVKEHLVNRVPMAQLMQRYGFQPDQYARWQEQLFENGSAAFADKGKKPGRPDDSAGADDGELQELEDQLADRDKMIAQLMKECVRSKNGD